MKFLYFYLCSLISAKKFIALSRNFKYNKFGIENFNNLKSYYTAYNSFLIKEPIKQIFKFDGINIYILDYFYMSKYGFPHHLYNYKFIELVEEEQLISINEDSYFSLQNNPIYNLDLIDQRTPILNNKYYYDYKGGNNSTVYIVDTGIDILNVQFEDRASIGLKLNDGDCINKHGTHVAGIIGSRDYGVAKKANLISVQVLDCYGNGSMSQLLSGLQWVYKNIYKNKTVNNIINMSLGSSTKSDILNELMKLFYNDNIFVVAAAGNSNSDACNTSPASSANVITVGSTSQSFTLSTFSNYGKCVNIFAPGEKILSTIPNNKIDYLTGTSQATPHVAGLLALLLTKYTDTFQTKYINDYLYETCTKNIIRGDLKESRDCFIYTIL